MRRNCCACFRTSLGVGDVWLFPHSLHIATSLAASRQMMSVVEKQNAKRDRVWPRNYSCWVRAPGRFEFRARRNGHTTQRRISHENDGEALARGI